MSEPKLEKNVKLKATLSCVHAVGITVEGLYGVTFHLCETDELATFVFSDADMKKIVGNYDMLKKSRSTLVN